MSLESKNKPKVAVKKPAAKTAASATMADRPLMTKAIMCFLKANTSFESSNALDALQDDIYKCKTLNDVFLAPLGRSLLNMEGALKFILFLRQFTAKLVAPDGAVADAEYTGGFSAETALDAIAQVFDLGLQSTVYDHVEDALNDGAEEDE